MPRPAVAGIDLAAGRGVTEVAILFTAEGGDLPTFQAERYREVITDDDILAAITLAAPAVIAIDAPLSLPVSVARSLTSASAAIVETAATSPYTRAAERDPRWKTLGVRPLPVSFLGGLTFRAISLLPRLRAAAPASEIIEVFPTATLRLLDVRPLEGQQKRLSKTTVAMRTAAQQGLTRWITGIPPVESALLGADHLDALAAALTGIMYLQGRYEALGDADEGQIIVPRITSTDIS